MTTSCTLPTCEHCRSRQKLHRIIDISLIVLASASAGVFLLAFARRSGILSPRHAFWLEVGALAGFALSALIWLVVAVATPAPMAVVDVAKLGARTCMTGFRLRSASDCLKNCGLRSPGHRGH